MKSSKAASGGLVRGFQAGVSKPPAAYAEGARAPRGRLSAAARGQVSVPGVAVAEPWAATGRCDIEALVNWAFGPQRALSPVSGLCEIEARAAGYAWQSVSADGVAAVQRIGEVGCRIDISGPGRDMVHPVAEMVSHMAALHPDGDLVRHHGRAGTRPAGWGRRPRYVPAMVRPDGEAEWVYDEAALPRRVRMQCPVLVIGSQEAVSAARSLWVRWWDALVDLQMDVAGAAFAFQVVRPACYREPWKRGLTEACLS